MPKSKINSVKKSPEKEIKEVLKETILDDEEKEVDPELIVGGLEEDEDMDEIGGLDDDEVDPFKDKWEE
jgi:hypothetical protein